MVTMCEEPHGKLQCFLGDNGIRVLKRQYSHFNPLLAYCVDDVVGSVRAFLTTTNPTCGPSAACCTS